jgi:hypothetical protein
MVQKNLDLVDLQDLEDAQDPALTFQRVPVLQKAFALERQLPYLSVRTQYFGVSAVLRTIVPVLLNSPGF